MTATSVNLLRLVVGRVMLMVVAGILILLVTLAASYFPARQATKVDPLNMLPAQ